MKRAFLLSIAVFLAFSLTSCDWLLPKEDLITPGMRIPPALTTSTNRGTRSGVPTKVEVFEPFRASLDVAALILDNCYTIIDTIRQNPIPDNMDSTFNRDQRIKVTYTKANEYKKRIEIYKNSSATEPYLVILYNKGIIKGKIYYNNDESPTPSTSAGHLVSVLVSYDETSANPTLEIRADLADDSDGVTNPRSLYYYGVYGSTGIQVHGGLGYHYVFSPDPGNNPDAYSAHHTYMYRSRVSVDETKASVELYFPSAANTGNPAVSDAVDGAMLGIVHSWINSTNNASIRTTLSNASPSIRFDSTINLKTDLTTWKAANSSHPSIDALLFILELDNPIAYSSTSGYVANGTLPAGYTEAELGSLAAIAWTLKPNEIYSLVVTKP